ncbi:MAG: cytochrome c biogenesis protein [Halarsenatibacteraceae bacterium]
MLDSFKKLKKYLFYALGIVVPLSILAIFHYAPEERVMGNVQRIFYYHVGSAWVGFLAFFIVFITSILYLRKKEPGYHRIALASAEIGVVFTTIVLATGMLWGRSAWNTWWTWDPRLTTSLILWLMYLGYLFLRLALQGEENEKQQRLAAVFGIIAFVNVPLVFFSIRWWRTIHPVVIDVGGTGLSSEMIQVLIFSVLTISLLYLQLVSLRIKQLKNKARLEKIQNSLRRKGGMAP